MFTCSVCASKFRTSKQLSDHIRNPGSKHDGIGKRRAPPRTRLPRSPTARIGPVPISLARPSETKLTYSFDVLNTTATTYVSKCLTLSGTNPSTHPITIPGLGATGKITRIEVEYRGSLDARIRWACVISDTTPPASADILAKVVSNAGTSSHDSRALFLTYQVGGPPLVLDATKPRVLYFCIERGAGDGTALAANITVNAFIEGSATVTDHVSL